MAWSSSDDGSWGAPRARQAVWLLLCAASIRQWLTRVLPPNGRCSIRRVMAVSRESAAYWSSAWRHTSTLTPSRPRVASASTSSAIPVRPWHRPEARLVRAPLGRARLVRKALLGAVRHQRARCERELHQRPVPRPRHGVVDLVRDREVVEGPAGGVLVIDVAGAPVRQRPADPAVEDVVRANEVRLLGERRDGPEMALTGRRRRPVDLVIAKARPDAPPRTQRRAGVHAHGRRRD